MRRIDWAVDFFCSGKFGPTRKNIELCMDLFCDCLDAKSRVVVSFVVLGELGDVKTHRLAGFTAWEHLILSHISLETLADVCVCFLELYDVTRPIGFLLNHLTMTCRDTRRFKP